MNVHIIRDEGVPFELCMDIYDLLSQYNGQINFILKTEVYHTESNSWTNKTYHTEDDLLTKRESSKVMSCLLIDLPEKRRELRPYHILKTCKDYRIKEDIGESEYVILLTNEYNDLNWFSFFDQKHNAFIDTNDWKYVLECESRFPIAYQVASLTLQMSMFKNLDEYQKNMHAKTIGCVNDFCGDKRDISLKLRTADICSKCIDIMEKKEVDNNIINNITKIFEGLRTKILDVEKFHRKFKPSRLFINPDTYDIHLFDLSNYNLRLTPLEKTVFIFFLRHPEGISQSEFQEYKKEVSLLYNEFTKTTNRTEQNNSIDMLVNPFEGSLQQKISKIKSKILKIVGPDFIKYYALKKNSKTRVYSFPFEKEQIINYDQLEIINYGESY